MSFPILSWRRIIIDGEETPYIISRNGMVMNDITGKFIKILPDKDNYPTVKIFVKGESKTLKVHRLVACAFSEDPMTNLEVDHVNRNHWDSDISNLEFVTSDENHRRMIKLIEIERDNLSNYKLVRKERTKYTENQVLQACIRLCDGESISRVSKITGIDSSTLTYIRLGKIWKHITCYFSFNDDSIFSKKELKMIRDMILDEFSNDEILFKLNINQDCFQYFYGILDKLRYHFTQD